ncbi:MAG: DUF4442 domain-containing protein [Proteobacteria bacterium]|nr:MAG: DUF4442 domain-containing protein [Pseudomonadota bacterium]
MGATSTLKRILPDLDGPTNVVREAWDRLHPVPGGKRIFSRIIGMMAPYTGTIGCQVQELRPGFARVELRDRRAVRNHLRCVHAIALANLAEVAGNVALAYSMPDDARFIVAGLTMEYVKKARGTIAATGECPIPASNERREFEVPVTMRDPRGEVVATCVLRTLVGPKKG